MSLRLFFSLPALLGALFIVGCASAPEPAPVSVPTPQTRVERPSMHTPIRERPLVPGEIYTGPPTAAIAPVVDGRAASSSQIPTAWIRDWMSQEIDQADIFAGVIPLPSRDQAHEADLLIQPALTELTWTSPDQRSGKLVMRIRATHLPTGRVQLDRIYTGDCRGCRTGAGQPAVAGPLAMILPDLIRDLERETIR